MFDVTLDGIIEKDEMYNLMMMFLEVYYFKYNVGHDEYKLWE